MSKDRSWDERMVAWIIDTTAPGEEAVSDDFRTRARGATLALGLNDITGKDTDYLERVIRAAVEAEREACLKIAETVRDKDIAAAIRARKRNHD